MIAYDNSRLAPAELPLLIAGSSTSTRKILCHARPALRSLLSPLESVLTQFSSASPLECALTKNGQGMPSPASGFAAFTGSADFASLRKSAQVSLFLQVAASLAPWEKSTPLESAESSLFSQNAGVCIPDGATGQPGRGISAPPASAAIARRGCVRLWQAAKLLRHWRGAIIRVAAH